MRTRKDVSKYNKTKRIRRRNGGDSDKKCMNTICGNKESEMIYEKLKKDFSTALEDHKRKIGKNKANSNQEEPAKEDSFLKMLTHTLTKMNNKTYKKKTIKDIKNRCNNMYCNEGCIGTLFEEGSPDKLPVKYDRTNKSKDFLDFNLEKRKQMFGKKTNVLKDNFYKELTKSAIHKLKEKGAISGCIELYVN